MSDARIAKIRELQKLNEELRARVAELTKERDDYVEGLREIELGGQPADNIARWTLEKWGKSTQ